MKKYIVSLVIPLFIFTSVAVLAQPTTTQAATLKDLINLLIGRGVITTDKVEQATKVAEELDETSNTTSTINPTCQFVFTVNLTLGSEGPDVVALQTLLISKGYKILSISTGRQAKGYFGIQTKAAVMNYQAANGLVSTGSVDAPTRTVLNRDACGLENPNQSGITILAPKDDVQVGFQYKLIWKDTRLTQGKGVSPIYVITIAGSNGKDLISENVSASSYCQSNNCYFGWSPTTISTNNQISIYDVVNDPNANIVGRSYFFDVVASTTNVEPTVTVLSPNGGEVWQVGKTYNIKWVGKNFPANSIVGIALQDENTVNTYLTDLTNYLYDRNIKTGSVSWTIPTSIAPGKYKLRMFCGINGTDRFCSNDGTIQSNLKSQDYSNSYFTIISSDATPYHSDSSVTASLVYAGEDKVGAWNTFGPGAGNINKNSNDWNWSAILNLSSEKTISRMTVKHDSAGEAWSTGYGRYLSDGTDLFNRDEHAYPLLVNGSSGEKHVTAYDQTLGTYPAGRYEFKLYGQPESTRFYGGQIVVEFSDGTSVKGTIPASGVTQSESAITQPSIAVISPNGGEVWEKGKTYGIVWSSSSVNLVSIRVIDIVTGTEYRFEANGLPPNSGISANQGYFAWTVPQSISSGSNYKVVITNPSNTSMADTSNSSFTIASPQITPTPTQTPSTQTLTILRPNGGESVVAGQTMNIAWSAANLPSAANIDSISLSLVSSSGDVYPLTVTKSSMFSSGYNGNYSNNGTATIIGMSIPATIPVGQYKLKVSCNSCGITDISDSYFNVLSSTAVPSIQVSTPSAGQTYSIGQNVNVTWTSSNLSATEPINILFSNMDNTTIGYSVNSAGVPNTGFYNWTIPSNVVPGNYKVQISCKTCSTTTGVTTYSWSGQFTIKAAGTASVYDSLMKYFQDGNY